MLDILCYLLSVFFVFDVLDFEWGKVVLLFVCWLIEGFFLNKVWVNKGDREIIYLEILGV